MPAISYRQLDDTSYTTQLINFIRPLENIGLAGGPLNDTTAPGLKPHWDGNTKLAIGYGTDLFVNSFSDIRARLSAVGVVYSDADALQIETAINASKAASKAYIAQNIGNQQES